MMILQKLVRLASLPETRQKLFHLVIDEPERGKLSSCRPVSFDSFIVTQAIRFFRQFIFLSQGLAAHKK
jgi:hypothetical protein